MNRCEHVSLFGTDCRIWIDRKRGPVVEATDGEKIFGPTIFRAFWDYFGFKTRTPEKLEIGGIEYRLWMDGLGKSMKRNGPVLESSTGEKWFREELCGYDSPFDFLVHLSLGI